MTVVGDAVADYLTIRRALGFKLVEHQRLLRDFATFLEQTGASTITIELAVAWAVRCRGTEGWKAARLSVIRGFAAYGDAVITRSRGQLVIAMPRQRSPLRLNVHVRTFLSAQTPADSLCAEAWHLSFRGLLAGSRIPVGCARVMSHPRRQANDIRQPVD